MTRDEEHELITSHLHVVERIANRILSSRKYWYADKDELVSAGNFGLVQAAKAFDIERGYAFRTFCGHRVLGAMRDVLRAHRRDVGFGRKRRVLVIEQMPEMVSADGEVTTVDLADPSAGPEEQALAAEERELIDSAPLSERERAVVEGKLEDRPQVEIGRAIGISESRVSQLVDVAIDKVRAHVASKPPRVVRREPTPPAQPAAETSVLWRAVRDLSQRIEAVNVVIRANEATRGQLQAALDALAAVIGLSAPASMSQPSAAPAPKASAATVRRHGSQPGSLTRKQIREALALRAPQTVAMLQAAVGGSTGSTGSTVGITCTAMAEDGELTRTREAATGKGAPKFWYSLPVAMSQERVG